MSEKRVVYVCCGTGCLANNSMDIYNELKRVISEKHIEIKVEPYVKATGCNGLCEKGPVVKIDPDDISYFKVGIGDVEEIVDETLISNQLVDRLLYFDSVLKKRVRSHREGEFYRRQHKIALRNIGEIDPLVIEDYIERGGYTALKKAISCMNGKEIIDEIHVSGLRGRGGAGFPTGTKWRQCNSIPSFPKYVVCNGDEGDPGAFMDRSIMEGDPFSIIEGMTICGYAIGAERGYIYIRDEYSLAVNNMAKGLEMARKAGYLGENILGSGFNFDIQIVRGGGAFVCGESTALMASIEGKVGEPRAKYIHSTEKGLWGQPTVLNNVETWANIPVIINKGGAWYSSIGIGKSRGTKVFSLVGKVKNTGLVEVPMGTTLRELIYDIGGGIIGNKGFKAVQIGGPSGGCIPEELLDLSVDYETLQNAESMMGSGGMIIMDERTCMVDVARYYLKFLSEESCGKCVPCREGVKRMLEILTDICEGRGKREDIDILTEISETVKEASLCGLGKSAPNPVMSTIKYFKGEYLEHINNRRCSAGVCKPLTSYYIDEAGCRGCGVCKSTCPEDAISGDVKKVHIIDEAKCIKCGNCINTCSFGAVKVR